VNVSPLFWRWCLLQSEKCIEDVGESAARDYGVVLDANLAVDEAAKMAARARNRP
jgi:hypothetical protein